MPVACPITLSHHMNMNNLLLYHFQCLATVMKALIHRHTNKPNPWTKFSYLNLYAVSIITIISFCIFLFFFSKACNSISVTHAFLWRHQVFGYTPKNVINIFSGWYIHHRSFSFFSIVARASYPTQTFAGGPLAVCLAACNTFHACVFIYKTCIHFVPVRWP